VNGKAATGEVDSIVETDDGPGIVMVRFVLINKRGGFKDQFEEPPEPETQRLNAETESLEQFAASMRRVLRATLSPRRACVERRHA
jgi:hypothetical protein